MNEQPRVFRSIVGEPAVSEPPSLLAEWREDVACVFERDPAARTRFEVLTTYPGVHAILLHRLSHRLWCRGFLYASRLLSFLTRLWTNIDIHPGATIGRRFFIDHGAGVVIGETAVVGDDVTLYHGVTLGGTSWNKGKRHPTLGDGVLVGAGAKILGPITLGDRVRVGANSVVVKDVPAHSTVVGIPGKVVQARREAAMNPRGIDLDHHRIPDVVNQTLIGLRERIEVLENRLLASASAESGRWHGYYEILEMCEAAMDEAEQDDDLDRAA
ncbi:serine O-acetyltransferase [Methylococcus sp. EFPC2]|uniref:serine O-acetyltransferase n=1 Tax=Methylococcus sp. EFPC2 TaxID=2812648 RepID=UPI001967BF39|nr:serine O-acetyltransferase [Methylococcus sp. EFPC2]QSA99210.1 serine O-acetyltransferase [Methylococcus sp. EFPC2]